MDIQMALIQAQQECKLDRLDAELLLAVVLDKPRSYLHSWPHAPLSPQQQESFTTLITRRCQGEPLAYITGEKEFWSLKLKVNVHTLIPRAETEVLVEQVLAIMPPSQLSILDLGTGSGAIALALASERPDCEIVASDVNAQALAVAKNNASLLAISNITFVQSDLFLNIDENFNIIISNPPYVEPGDPHLHDLRYEPQGALVAEDQGLAIIKAICQQASEYLIPQGTLVLEHGYNQSKSVQDLFRANGYKAIKPFKDYSGHWRGVIGQII